MAATKRLNAECDDSRIAARIQQLAFSDAGLKSEPYLSMALDRFKRRTTDPGHWGGSHFGGDTQRWGLTEWESESGDPEEPS